MYIERKELVAEIRTVRSYIDGEIKVLNGNIKDLYSDISKLREVVELLNQKIGQLDNICSN